MLDVLRAEGLKMRSHRATWLLIWIIPILFGLGVAAQVTRDLIYGAPAPAQAIAAAMWLQESTRIWRLPLDGTGRFLIAGFAALVFAGEYGWNTWKLVVPVQARWQLVAAKWCVAVGFVVVALAAAAMISLLGSVIGWAMGGVSAPAGVTAAAIASAHAMAALNAILPLLYTIAWAGLFAIFTGSLLAALGLSVVVVVIEQLLLPVGLLLSGYVPWMTKAALLVLPFYHSANVIAGMTGPGLVLPLGADHTLGLSWGTSAMMLAVWIGAIGGATLLRFGRQDLN